MRISHRLGILTGLAVAVPVGIYGVSEERSREQALGEAMAAQAEAIGAVMASAIEAELSREDHTSRERAIEAAMNLAIRFRSAGRGFELRNVALETYSLLETTAAQKERLRRVRILDKPYGEFVENPPRYALAFPVRGKTGDIVGVIDLVGNAQAIERGAREVTFRLGITLAGLLVALSVAVNTVIRRSVVRPIRRLLVGVDEVARGDLSRAVLVERDDELGLLATHFNRMTHALREARLDAGRGAEARLRLEEQLRHAEKLATMGQLAAEIAHEVGTPLNVIGGRARAIVKKASDVVEVQKNAAIVSEQVARITAIIQQILDFSRRRPAPEQDFDLSENVRTAVDLLEHPLSEAGVTVHLDLGDGLRVRGDPLAIQQVSCNLILNAAQATPRGGQVDVRTARETRRREGLQQAAAAKCVVVEVADRGPGIPDVARSRVFEPFFTTKPQGTGLGLAIAQSIAKDHDGWLEHAPRLGGGSTFSLCLPSRDPGQTSGSDGTES